MQSSNPEPINCGITRPNSPHCFERIEDTMADPESSKSGTGDVQHFARDDAPLSLSCQLP